MSLKPSKTHEVQVTGWLPLMTWRLTAEVGGVSLRWKMIEEIKPGQLSSVERQFWEDDHPIRASHSASVMGLSLLWFSSYHLTHGKH